MEPIQQTAGKHYTGHCHCGHITFEMTGPLRPIVVCHCTDCLRISGFSWAATNVEHERFRLTSGEEALVWYNSSDFAKRGFCSHCHSHMFYSRNGKATISVAPGMIDDLDGLHCVGHIYRASLPDCCAHIDQLADIDKGFES